MTGNGPRLTKDRRKYRKAVRGRGHIDLSQILGLSLKRGLTAFEGITDAPRSRHAAETRVRFWHKADMPRLSSNVRFWG
jgi:hypothetical protein